MNKQQKISKIKDIISEYGIVNICELDSESSPCISSIGDGKNNICELVEQLNLNGVETSVYHGDIEIRTNNYLYEELSSPIINKIYNLFY